jgi:4-amino-4-deoxy-L-arabinose transferase-like glycosyltransferase
MAAAKDRHKLVLIAIAVVAVAVRLIAIDQPFIDNWSWRQSDVAAIARNFYAHGFHFAYPRIDWAGDAPGYVGTEFPILPFIAALCYRIGGVHEWIGRMQAVIFFAASLPFFFLLVRNIFGGIAATWATIFYSFAPLSIVSSRAFMPDIPSLSLALIGLYFFLRWIDSERTKFLVVAATAVSLSILIKLPTALIGLPLLFLAWEKWRWNFVRQPALWLFAVVALLPSAIWYWHAHEIALRCYPHHFFGAGGIQIENFAWYLKIARLTVTSTLTPLLFIAAVIGLFAGPRRRHARLFHWWLIAMLLFIVIVGYGNRHQWYQLPLVPIAAAFGGATCALIASRFSNMRRALIVLSILFVGSFGLFSFKYAHPVYRSRSSAELRDLGLELKRTTPEGSLIIAADNGDPTVFYYGERRGWHILEEGGIYNGEPTDSEEAIVDLEKLRRRGATHLVFTTNTIWWLDYYKEFAQRVGQSTTLMETTPEFKIYKLNPAQDRR